MSAQITASWRESQEAKAQASEERQQQLFNQNQHILLQVLGMNLDMILVLRDAFVATTSCSCYLL